MSRISQAILIGCMAAALSWVCLVTGLLEKWEGKTWDWRAATLANPSASTEQIRLIFLDQSSLDWGKERGWSWPWPRQVYSAVLDFCRRAGTKAVAFDVIFSEPSAWGVEDDEVFGSSVGSSRGFVGALFVSGTSGGETNWPAQVPTPAMALQPAGNPDLSVFTLPRAVFPVTEMATNATLLATVFGNPDDDGIYRRMKPFSLFAGQPVPCLGLGAYLAAATGSVIRITPTTFSLGPNTTPLPLDRHGNAILKFRGPSQTHKTVNIAAVIESELRMREGNPPLISPSFFTHTYVFLGFTAPGLFDLRSSPVAAVYPGVELHATFLDNLLASTFMRESPLPLTFGLVLLLAIAGSIAVRLSRTAWQAAIAGLVLLPIPTLLGVLAYTRGWWLPIVVQYAAFTPAFVATLAVNYATEGRQKRFIKGAFKQYLSPVVIEELVQHPERLALGGETRELSLFFSDVKGFTSLSERLTPEQLTALLNDYLTAMTDVIYAHGGTVDKYEGDAIIAFWNAPLAQPDHATRAVRAAMDCQTRLAELNPSFRKRIGSDLVQRIGINSGPVVVGNMGSRQRFNYTILGDAAKLASRLEGINKQFGTSILISENTRAQLSSAVTTREIGRVQVVGRKEPVRVFEPIPSTVSQPDSARLSVFANGLAAYYAGKLPEALHAFESLAPDDPVAAAYSRRCREFANHPVDKWDGIWIMTEK